VQPADDPTVRDTVQIIAPDYWQHRLGELAATHRVPGAVVGLSRLGAGDPTEFVCAAGVLGLATGAPATVDSIFQIGSITKVWTAALVVQLADEGRLDLDAPVRSVLPELELADPSATETLTARQLLTHTSGIDGDVFTDTGRGEECLERYVAHLRRVAQLYPVGTAFSYCNAGFALLGRIIEVAAKQPWDDTLRERLIRPLRLPSTVTLAEDAILHRVAVGHVNLGGEIRPADRWAMPRAMGPAGGITCSMADLLTFAQLFLNDGKDRNGVPIMSSDAVAEMTRVQVERPGQAADQRRGGGLGWGVHDWNGATVLAHAGGTIGQAAFLVVVPGAALAVGLMTNGGDAAGLFRSLVGELLDAAAGLSMPALPHPPPSLHVAPTGELERHVGRYERANLRMDVVRSGSDLILRTEVEGLFADVEPSFTAPLVPVGPGEFLYRSAVGTGWVPLLFRTGADGRDYICTDDRVTPRAR
jgi:CubicO group peptidase (beta-lactamase class C family)